MLSKMIYLTALWPALRAYAGNRRRFVSSWLQSRRQPKPDVPRETPEGGVPVVASGGNVQALIVNPDWARHPLIKFKPESLADVPADALWVRDGKPFVVLHHEPPSGLNLPPAKGQILWTFDQPPRFGFRRTQKVWVNLPSDLRYDTASRVLAPAIAPSQAVETDQADPVAAPEAATASLNGHSRANGAVVVKESGAAPMNSTLIKQAMEGQFSSSTDSITPTAFGQMLDMKLVRERHSKRRSERLQKALDKAKPFNWVALGIIVGLTALIYILGQQP